MSREMREAKVFVQDRFAGILLETESGYSFKYDDDYLAGENPLPVSLTLPIDNREYTSKVLFSFFDGLIPEGWLLDVASRNWKIDKEDRFALLTVCCKDPIGDVRIGGAGDEV